MVSAQTDASDGDTLTDGMGIEADPESPTTAVTDAPKGWQCVNKQEISTCHHNNSVAPAIRSTQPHVFYAARGCGAAFHG